MVAATEVPDTFDARFSALSRRYEYRVTDAPWGAEPLRRHDTLAWPRPLSLDAIRAAAEFRAAPELTIVVPTLNERDNVPDLVERIGAALPGIDWELMFVDDDSPDGTAAIAKAMGGSDARIRCIRRIGRRGLAGACLEGMLASQARYVAVIDGDLQHDEALLAPMVAALRSGDTDVVVGSRYQAGGSAESSETAVGASSLSERAPTVKRRTVSPSKT